MFSPISSPGVLPVGSCCELYPTDAEETRDSPNISRAICQDTNQQRSVLEIARYNPEDFMIVEPYPSPKALAEGIPNLMEAGSIQHNFAPTEAREFVDTMRAIRRPTGNKITRNREEGASTIEFRPQYGLGDIHGLGLFLQQKGGFAGCTVDVEQKSSFNEKEFSYSSISVRNYQDLVGQRYKQLWESCTPENSEKYEIPDSEYPNSTMWPEKKKTVDQLEKELSYQERLLRRAVNMMNSKQKESDEEIPFDPAFTRIFIPTEEEYRTNKVTLSTMATVTSIFFEYKTQVVPLEQERACIAEISAMPTYTVDEIKKAITEDLRDHPIEIVDLHQISHLLEKLGGYASSSALVEREYTIDGKKRHCTAIVLRNRQDLVDERYACLWEKYRTQHDLPYQAPLCNYPMPFLQKEKTFEEAQEQLFSQAQLLQRAVENMYIDEKPFDPLFERIYIPTDQERIDNKASISNLAQTDTILFVYRTSSEDRPPKYAVEQICAQIKTTAEREGIETPMEETSIVSRVAQTCLPLLRGIANHGVRFFIQPGE